ncbi:MAG: hypothetical protein AB1656_21045 [Candidatus Omnitrophota bacterium]
MALRRLLLGISVLSVVFVNNASAQFEPTTANQDGILILDALGRIFSVSQNGDQLSSYLFKELADTSNQFQFPFPVAKDIELVGNPDGSLKGAYALDVLGGQFSLTLDTPISVTAPDSTPVLISTPAQVGAMHSTFSAVPYFGWDVAKDLEISPDWRNETYGYRGYFVLDADGVVHPVGATNLPSYVFDNLQTGEPEIVESLYPGTIDISGSEVTVNDLLKGGPINYPVNRLYFNQNVKSVTPIFAYFGSGSDIARDLEISAEYAQLTAPSKSDSSAIENRTIAMTNGYYILDGFGAVHSNRLALDFDVDNDNQILYDKDMLQEDFGKPINNIVLASPWEADKGDLPYFGWDVAIDVEITPSGKGFYLLDEYGGVFAIGDAALSFPPKIDSNGNVIPVNSIPPFFGFPIARDLALVPNKENKQLGVAANSTTTGLLVLTGDGTVHPVGLANAYDISNTGNNGAPVTNFSDSFRAIETTPLWLPGDPSKKIFTPGAIVSPGSDLFVIGGETYASSLAPKYRNVTADYTTITDSYTQITGAD